MTDKPTYEELEQRIKALENDLDLYRSQNGVVHLSEQYLKAILDNTNLAIYLKDADYRYILMNKMLANLAHVTEEQVIGKDDFAIFPEPIAELFRSQDEEVKQRNTLVEFTETIELANGVHTYLTAKFPMHDAAGNINGIAGACTDITELEQAREKLVESEKKYRNLVETASLGIQISDRDGRIILSNPAHHKIHGYPAGEIMGKYVWDFIDDESEKKQLQEYYSYIIKHQPEPEPYLTSNMTRNGRQLYTQIDWNYMRDKNGYLYALCSIINDVTEKVRAEKALKASAHKFKSVIESCPDGIHLYKLEPDGRLIFSGANPAAEKILGVDCVRFIGKTIEEAFPALADTEVPERYREVCRTGKPWQTERIVYEDDQIKGAFEVHAFQPEQGNMAVFFTDITKKRRMEEEIQKIQKLESVGMLAGGIAHDFNNLLMAILGNISMAKKFTQPGENVFERLNDAEKATLRAQDLTQQLLTFAKGGAPVKNSGSIKELIEDSTSFTLSGSNVTYEIAVPDDIWPVEMDEGQISQVIQNVVKNAAQAMPDGGKVSIRVENIFVTPNDHIPLAEGKFVKIAIADQGVGISSKHIAKVFDPYFSTKQDGRGLGLAASYSIVNNHNGLLKAESTQDSGSTFHIYLPASENKPAVKKVTKEQRRQNGEKILIMDDDIDVLNVSMNMLNMMGYKTGTAHDGAEAVALFTNAKKEGRPFDAVILDLTIPGGMGGLETARQLINIDPDIKAVVSSGYATDPIMANFEQHGFRAVIAKPYTMKKLEAMLRQLLN